MNEQLKEKEYYKGIHYTDLESKDLIGTLWTYNIGLVENRVFFTETVLGYDSQNNVYLSRSGKFSIPGLLMSHEPVL